MLLHEFNARAAVLRMLFGTTLYIERADAVGDVIAPIRVRRERARRWR
jgi:hypothetical protein